jgi:hypothetical protein
MEFSAYQDRMREFTQKQDAEWETFLDFFRVANPEPQMREVYELSATKREVGIGIKFWLALASGIGALALSGFRVSERFFQVAGGSTANPFFSYGEAISGVLAVNVTIFALAIAYAYTAKKMSESSQYLGLGTAILISAVAGLGQAAKALGPEWAVTVSFFDLILAGVLGLGATALEYFSGDLLGVEIVLFLQDKLSASSEFKTEQKQNLDKYQAELSSAEQEYTEQHKAWVRLAKSQFGLWKANFLKWNEQVEQERSAKPNTVQQVGSRSGSFAELVRSVLDNAYAQNQTVLFFSDLCSALASSVAEQQGVSEQNYEEFVRLFVQKKKAQVSELRTKWMKERGL